MRCPSLHGRHLNKPGAPRVGNSTAEPILKRLTPSKKRVLLGNSSQEPKKSWKKYLPSIPSMLLHPSRLRASMMTQADTITIAVTSPSSSEFVLLTVTVRGSVSDYPDTSFLQQIIATAAGVEASAVIISVAAASVIITATIEVPTTTTAATVQARLSTSLATATAAEDVLGIPVEAVPVVLIANPPSGPPPPSEPPLPPQSPPPPPRPR